MHWGLAFELIAAGARGGVCTTRKCKAMSKSTVISTISYLRGATKWSYLRLADLVGGQGWTSYYVLEYFKKVCVPIGIPISRQTQRHGRISQRYSTPVVVCCMDSGTIGSIRQPPGCAMVVEEAGLSPSPEVFGNGELVGRSAWVPLVSTLRMLISRKPEAGSDFPKGAIHCNGKLAGNTYTHAKRVLVG